MSTCLYLEVIVFHQSIVIYSHRKISDIQYSKTNFIMSTSLHQYSQFPSIPGLPLERHIPMFGFVA